MTGFGVGRAPHLTRDPLGLKTGVYRAHGGADMDGVGSAQGLSPASGLLSTSADYDLRHRVKKERGGPGDAHRESGSKEGPAQ